MNPLELVRLQLKLLFGYSGDRFGRDFGFTGNFLHRYCRISLEAFFDVLEVLNGVDCALSAASTGGVLKPGRAHGTV